MKDEHDHRTIDFVQAEKPTAKPFRAYQAVQDEKSFFEPKPKGAKPDLSGRPFAFTSCFVPVSFVAKDWGVSARRIRALLLAGRLDGRQQVNGVWEVRHPYSFVFGTRGPSLKRQQRPAKRPRLVVDNTERNPG